ncbi:MAG: hypothetical protein L0207_00530 [Chlamydiae bacterium]|nr:hypothetical protein [Chlamydiota bacterium]
MDNKIISIIDLPFNSDFNGIKTTIYANKEKIFTVLVFTGIALLAVKWIFSSPSNPLKTRGHFLSDKYPQHFDNALKITEKCFNRIVNPNANNRWDWIYLSQKKEIFTTIRSTKIDGTCFGNVAALAKAIIRKGKILTAAELQQIEKGDKFPKRAMGFQLLQPTCKEICKRVDAAYDTPAFEKPSELTLEDKGILGKRAKYFCYNRHTECLKTYNLSFQDVSELSDEKFKVLYSLVIRSDVPFEWARNEIFKKPDLKTSKDLIEWGASQGFPDCYVLPGKKGILRPGGNLFDSSPNFIYPKPEKVNVSSKESFYLSHTIQKSDLIKKCPEINQPNFSGFFIIRGSDNNGNIAGHVLLLEIDNLAKIHVLYDNNCEFYPGENLEDCLNELNTLWQAYACYNIRVFHPYIFKG